jgi:hypothetical protein
MVMTARNTLIVLGAIFISVPALPMDPTKHQNHQEHEHQQKHSNNHAATDIRVKVVFPKRIYNHTLSSMRNHLEALHNINLFLSSRDFASAAKLAEEKLGMSSLGLHGAHESGKYMPKQMAELGMQLHRSASQFSLAAQEATVSENYGETLKALSKVTQSCVACHSAYRLVQSKE